MDRTQTVQALEVLRRCAIWIYVLLTYLQDRVSCSAFCAC